MAAMLRQGWDGVGVRRWRIAIVIGAILASCAPATTPSPPPSTSPTRTVKIVSSFPLTGPERFLSLGMVNAINMALDEAQHRAGSLAVEYESMDDATAARQRWDVDQEVANARRASADPRVVAYIGPINSPVAVASIPILCEAGLVMVSPGATNPGFSRLFREGEPAKYYPNGCARNFARVIPADDFQGAAAASWARDLGARSVFVVEDTGGPYGKALAEAFRDRAKQSGPNEAGLEATSHPGATAELIGRIRSSGADTLYYSPNAADGTAAFVQAVRSALPQIRFIGSDLLVNDAFLKAAGASAEGLFATVAGPPPDKFSGTMREWLAKYQARFGDRAPDVYALYAYEATRVILAALARAGDGADRARVRELVMATRDFDGVLGKWSFDANGDITNRRFAGMIVHQGAFQFEREIQ